MSKQCEHCDVELIERRINFETVCNTSTLIVYDIRAMVCPICGERILLKDAVDKINQAWVENADYFLGDELVFYS